MDHGSDITPGQRPQQQLDLSSQCYKTISSSKHSSPNVVIIKSKRPNSVMQNKAPQLTPTANTVKTLRKKVKTHIISSCEPTPKNQEPPEFQGHSLSPSPPVLSSSLTADSFDIQHKRQGPGRVNMSVSAIAQRLCDCLRFPLVRRRNLAAESREVLLKALQERHGPWLQENLLKEQRHLRFGTDLTKAAQDHDQEPTMMDEDASLFKASQPRFDTEKTTSFKVMGSGLFNWKSSLHPHQFLDQVRFATLLFQVFSALILSLIIT
ncbi:hypothetical protein INR49_001584 [Caranx melampygus]|nr:hypothetical protein INR49_001584 [Caranx melampygus]